MSEKEIQEEVVQPQMPQGRSNRKAGRNKDKESAASDLIEKLVFVNRVAKVVKGGRRFSFAALIVVGDGNGRVGVGTGKAREVPAAITKATEAAKKSMVKIALKEGRTLHHDIHGHFGASRVVMRTAKAGTGVIAGGAMRAVLEAAGVKDVVSKSIGSSNPYNLVYATMEGLKESMSPKMVAMRRGKSVSDIIVSLRKEPSVTATIEQ